MRGVLRMGLLPALLLICLGTLTAGAAPNPRAIAYPSLQIPGPVRGAQAVRLLGNNLNEIAARYGTSGADLQGVLLRDHDLWLDARTRLVYRCGFGFQKTPAGLIPPAKARAAKATAAAPPFPLDQTFLLHSLPGSKKVLYLDFKGFTTTGTAWNDTQSTIVSTPWDLDGNPQSFNETESTGVQEVWQQVAEDYAPFDVDVTTQQPDVENLRKSGIGDDNYGIRVVISPTKDPAPDAGGVAFIGSFNWDTDTPAFVITSNLGDLPKNIAEATSHEVGHTVGLTHDGVVVNGTTTEYYAGHGNWAPIMGVGYGKPIVQFSKGEYENANNPQDDLAVIPTFGMEYRKDDHGSTIARAEPLVGLDPVVSGVIETRDDLDTYSFFTGAGTISLKVAVAPLSPNLDVKLSLYDSSGTLVNSASPTDTLTSAITQSVASGTYYVTVDGVGAGDPVKDGYSDYGSIGQYTLTAQLIDSLRLISPRAKDIVVVGQDTDITWTSNGLTPPGNVKLELSRDSGVTWEPIIASTPNSEDGGTFTWIPTEPATDHARIRITSVESPTVSDSSSADFRIVEGSLDVTSPNGDEVLRLGRKFTITWDAVDYALTASKQVKIELSRNADSGSPTWETLFVSTPNDGSQDWIVTGPVTEQAAIRVTAVSVRAFSDESDVTFAIRPVPVLTVMSPNGGEALVGGDTVPIQFTSSGFTGAVQVEASLDGGGTWEVVDEVPAGDGAVLWEVPEQPTHSARVRVTALEEDGVSDLGNGLFEIVEPSLQVTAPGPGKIGVVGQPLAITWTSTGLSATGNVKVELSRNGGASWETIQAATPNDGSTEWVVSGGASESAVIRVTSIQRDGVEAESDEFTLARPTLALASPTGSTRWQVGHQGVIQWRGTILGYGTVKVELSRDGGRRWSVIIPAAPNTGGVNWGVTNPVTQKAKVRVTWNSDPTLRALSRVFRIERARKKSR